MDLCGSPILEIPKEDQHNSSAQGFSNWGLRNIALVIMSSMASFYCTKNFKLFIWVQYISMEDTFTHEKTKVSGIESEGWEYIIMSHNFLLQRPEHVHGRGVERCQWLLWMTVHSG